MEFPNFDVLQDRVVELKISPEAANFTILQEFPDFHEKSVQGELAAIHPDLKKFQKSERSDHLRREGGNVLNDIGQQRILSHH